MDSNVPNPIQSNTTGIDFTPIETFKGQQYIITNRAPSTAERKNSTFGRNDNGQPGCRSIADSKSNKMTSTDRYVNTTVNNSEPLMFSFTKNEDWEHEEGDEVAPLGKIEEASQENNQTQSEF